MYNLDETHFFFDQDNSKALGFLGESTVNYAEVRNGSENFTLVTLVRGAAHAYIESIVAIFKNENANYPILGIADDLEYVSYRTGRKVWMDQRVFYEMFGEERLILREDQERNKLVFLDNVRSHGLTEE